VEQGVDHLWSTRGGCDVQTVPAPIP
jgi:hypothetical protein